MEKNPLQQLLIFTPNFLGVKKFIPLPRNFTRTKPCSEKKSSFAPKVDIKGDDLGRELPPTTYAEVKEARHEETGRRRERAHVLLPRRAHQETGRRCEAVDELVVA